MAKFKVAMVDYDYATLDAFRGEVERLGGEFVHHRCKDIEEAIARFGDADGWLIQYLSPIGEKVFASCRKLKVVGRCGIGYDVIDVAAATRHKVVACNVPSYCEDEVSDHAMALMLSFIRKTVVYTNAVKAGKWDWKIGAPIPRLRGMTLGLMGFGKIPRTLAPKARAFGLNVITHDPFLKPEQAAREGVEMVDFNALLARSDFLSIHCPLNDQTRGMFNASAFARMKKTAVLINTARGGVINTADLARALDSGALAAACLDVMPQEPPDPADPLLRCANLVISPHVGWYSEGSIINLQTLIARYVSEVCLGRKPEAVVNPEVLAHVTLS